jgi:transcriptional regulator with XRE-family HTH domain
MTILANNLKYLRKKSNLSQQTIAENIGVDQKSYSNYETGHTAPNANILIKISDFFGKISIDLLLRVILSKEHYEFNNDVASVTGTTQGEAFVAIYKEGKKTIKDEKKGREHTEINPIIKEYRTKKPKSNE